MKKVIESTYFEDAQLRKAYSDYMYTREMTDCDEEASADDLAEVSLRYLKQHGKLDKIGTVPGSDKNVIKISVDTGGDTEAWLLAVDTASSLNDAVTASLEGRTYPYAILRLSGAGDPLETARGLEPGGGERSQREAVTSAAKEFSELAAGMGIATGITKEVYHPGFAAAQMETAAVISAAPAVNMRNVAEEDADILVLLSADETVTEDSGSESSAGAATYLRRVRRLFADGDSARMIKSCSAEGGFIRCLIAPDNKEAFEAAAAAEGLECTVIERSDNAGAVDEAEGRISIEVPGAGAWSESYLADESLSFQDAMKRIAEDLNTCSGRGLTERFDSTIGGRTVMMPLSGINQLTPMQAAAYKLPETRGDTDDCTIAAWGYNPYISEASPYHGGYLAVIEAVSGLIATGASFNEIYLAVQRYTSGDDSAEFAALLGAFEAEMGLSVPAISAGMSASDMPGLAACAVTQSRASETVSPDFKGAGHKVVMLTPEIETDASSAYYGLPTPESLKSVWRKAYELIANGRALSAYAPGMGGTAEAVMKMCYGGALGFVFEDDAAGWESDNTKTDIFSYSYGSIILEMATDDPIKSRSVDIIELGTTAKEHYIQKGSEAVEIGELMMLYEGKLESVYPVNADSGLGEVGNFGYSARSWYTTIYKRAVPKVLIPALPGTAGEDALMRAIRSAGGSPDILKLPIGSEDEVRRAAESLAEGIRSAQIVVLTSEHIELFRDEEVAAGIKEFLDSRDGLMLGIGDGFRALLELGLLPYGRITEEGAEDANGRAEITINTLGAHQSRIARVCVASNKSPWLRSYRPGEIYSLPVSNTFGRFTAPEEMIRKLSVNGQIATQYVDDRGRASTDIRFNPSGSAMAIEGISSVDGRVLGRMGRIERCADGLYRNVPGRYNLEIFENGMRYFK